MTAQPDANMLVAGPAFAAVVDRTVADVVCDIDSNHGRGVAGLLWDGLLQALGGDTNAWRRAGWSIAARQVDARALPGKNPATVPLWHYAVCRRSTEAAAALIVRADGSVGAAGMLRAALRCGWEEGVKAMLDSGAAAVQDRVLRDDLLALALEKPALLRMLLTQPMAQRSAYGGTRFFGGPRGTLNVALSLATLAQPRREEALAVAGVAAPAFLEDLEGAAGRYGKKADSTFFFRLGEVASGLADDGLDFLVRKVCRTPEARWRLVLILARRGNPAQQLEAACRRQPDLDACVARQAGTARGVREMVDAIAAMPLTASSIDPQTRRMAWVQVVAGRAWRTPPLRAWKGRSEIETRLLASWQVIRMAVKDQQRLAGGDGSPVSGRRRRRA